VKSILRQALCTAALKGAQFNFLSGPRVTLLLLLLLLPLLLLRRRRRRLSALATVMECNATTYQQLAVEY